MRHKAWSFAVLGIILVVSVVDGVQAGDNRSGVGFALTGGNVDPEGPVDDVEFKGGSIFGRIGFTDRWGLRLAVRSMEDDEDIPGISAEYDQFSVEANLLWRHGKRVRPFVRFGITQIDLELTVGPVTVDDDETGAIVGGGLEAGTDRVAFYGDVDFSSIEFGNNDVDFGAVNLGMIFKF